MIPKSFWPLISYVLAVPLSAFNHIHYAALNQCILSHLSHILSPPSSSSLLLPPPPLSFLLFISPPLSFSLLQFDQNVTEFVATTLTLPCLCVYELTVHLISQEACGNDLSGIGGTVSNTWKPFVPFRTLL